MLLVQAIALGLVVGFFCFELTGIVAAGLVTPGYFAIYFDQPLLIAESIGVAILTMLLVRLASTVTVLYGRRRFILTILLGFCLQWLIGGLFWGAAVYHTRIDAVGFIIPGLIAHEMERQGAGVTLIALLVVSTVVRILLHLFMLI